jgi:16S rRNA (adenine1518-N6/adenine1519-N6)-dimethyltransferase
LNSDLAPATLKLLKQHDIKPRRKLGQNFLVDTDLIEEIMEVADLSSEDDILEIGAGLGTLTRVLAERARHVFAVEIDPALSNVLSLETSNLPNLKIIDGDILQMTLPNVSKIISNVPYSISSPLLLKILESIIWKKSILTLQKDFAARLNAKVGSKEYGRLTIAATYYSDVKLHGSYPPESFLPASEVYSQIVELQRRPEPPFHVRKPEVFWSLSRILFTQRNRLLSKSLKTLSKSGNLPKAWSQVLLERAPERLLTRRVRELAPEDFATLSDLVSSRAGTGLG